MEHGTLGLAGPERNPNLMLVHGEVTGQGPIAGVQYGHAWIEDGETVIDTSNGRHLRMSRATYYGLAQIDPDKPNIHRYTAEQARRQLLKYRHYGPWDLKTSTGL